jgi:hypothetical protein
MKRLIQLLRFPEIHPILVMNYVFDEMTAAFTDYNCQINIVTKFEDLKNEGIIFLDNGMLYNNPSIIHKLAIKCPDVVYFVWYWNDINTYKPLNQVFKYMIYMGNHCLKVPTKDNLLREYNNYITYGKYCPFKFRANEDPELIGKYERINMLDYCFMGYYYRQDWIPTELIGINHATTWENYLTYYQRKQVYLSSTFALGFHGDDPIDCGSISQRVFEGMAYGCVVLCDNPIAEEITDGIVVTVTSKQDVLDKIRYYKEHPELIIEKQQKGYEWAKKYGTNRETVKVLLNKLKEVYNIEFE